MECGRNEPRPKEAASSLGQLGCARRHGRDLKLDTLAKIGSSDISERLQPDSEVKRQRPAQKTGKAQLSWD